MPSLILTRTRRIRSLTSMRPTRPQRRGMLKTKCDALFSEIIRMRDGWECRAKGLNRDLTCAHIFSRRHWNTRWDLDNAVCLSLIKHRYYTDHPFEWEAWVIENLGQEHYDRLRKLTLINREWNIYDLQKLYEDLKALRASWDKRDGCFRLHTNPGRAITRDQS